MDGISLAVMRLAVSLVAAHGQHHAPRTDSPLDRPGAPAYLLQTDVSRNVGSAGAAGLTTPTELLYSSVPAAGSLARTQWQTAKQQAIAQPAFASATLRTCFSETCRR